MSIQLIQQYHAKVEQLIRYGGTRNESTLRKPFQDLLEQYARSKNLLLVPEVEYTTRLGRKVYPDGTLKDSLRQDWGYWESKDEKDDLDAEIEAKFAKGYPRFNILFEDTQTAVLFQGGEEVLRASFEDVHALDRLLNYFVSYEPPEVREFHKAIELFTADVQALADTLRKVIDEQYQKNHSFKSALHEFLELSRKAINPKVELADMREMIIQHVLTEDIFMRVFDEAEFHRENVIAHKLQEVAGTFYTGDTKRNIHARIAPYYETINAKASQISDHHEKQKFLKALYENFYRAYNPKAADRLGVIYTPDEIVRFMIESADHLVFKHFGKTLGDRDVEILDPATGTGTFITELIEYLPLSQLEAKYRNEIHCNEVAILPYYIANLNIEYTYKQKTGRFVEFENILFVDTLDNLGFSTAGQPQLNFFGLVDENALRIDRQNQRKISVIIGNPPYNAWQESYNNQNANRAYPVIDKRIKETYVKYGTAQNQNALYDMYTRFIRWASDRLSKDGIIAFISNNSFIDSRAFDGFRKVLSKEFSNIYIIDLKGNARTSGERRQREGGNIFDDQIKVGVAIYFLIRKEDLRGCKIFYKAIEDYASSNTKRLFLSENKFSAIHFESLTPDKNQYWLNVTYNDWEDLLPLGSKKSKGKTDGKFIFSLFSRGNASQRDEWVYDFSRKQLEKKIRYFIDIYENTRLETNFPDKMLIKWDRELTKYLKRGEQKIYNANQMLISQYRPFVKMNLYFDRHLNGMVYQIPNIFPNKSTSNIAICVNVGIRPFNILSINSIPDLHFNGDSQCFPIYRYTSDDIRMDNITDWALKLFNKHYHDKRITKLDIFHYVYAVLHNPAYREKYKLNLKRDLPRIPFYDDFWKWAGWGKQLMELHLYYEQVEPYPLARHDLDPEKTRKAVTPRLLARKETGVIEVDTLTTLQGVPPQAWEYRLGTYTALEWVLDRYKEKKPRDPTIREKFNTYRFADYKESVIDLLRRVCTVSVETMDIIHQMPE